MRVTVTLEEARAMVARVVGEDVGMESDNIHVDISDSGPLRLTKEVVSYNKLHFIKLVRDATKVFALKVGCWKQEGNIGSGSHECFGLSEAKAFVESFFNV